MPQPYTWPLFFARKALRGTRLSVEAGAAFPFQDRATLRGFGPAYGIRDADTRPFGDLPYVHTLNVHTEEMRQHILRQGLSYDEARALLEGMAAPSEPQRAEAP